MERIAPPELVVTDGGSGFEKARKNVWPQTRVQRCTFHVFGQITRATTTRPRLEASGVSVVLCRRWLEVGDVPLGVGGGELGEGLFPVGCHGAFDEAGGGSALGPGCGGLGAFGGSAVFDVADREPQELDGGVVVGEVSPVLRDFAQLVVQGFDRVRRIHDAAEHGRQREERREPVPGALPGVQSVRILIGPRSGGELGQALQGRIFA